MSTAHAGGRGLHQHAAPASSDAACPLCGGVAEELTGYAWRCTSCDVRFSSLEPQIEAGAAIALDEDKRVAGLRAVRERSHAVLLDAIAAQRPLAGLLALDIGCGHGWFLEAAIARGVVASGIEPDRAVAARARARGLDVRDGYFPDDVAGDARFDLIAFNDVFEHLPDPGAILTAVRERLQPDGLLAICIPTAEGLGYRIATALARVGLALPLDRLWQHGLPSPHLWYFTEHSLEALVTAHGFATLATGRLPSVERRGLRDRAGADPRSGLVQRLSVAGVALAAPLLNSERFSDAMWLLFRQTDDA